MLRETCSWTATYCAGRVRFVRTWGEAVEPQSNRRLYDNWIRSRIRYRILYSFFIRRRNRASKNRS